MTPAGPAVDAAARRRDAGRSRARLLAAATELFAERGYTGTALRAVAERAGVDAALIARYYGGKDGLYQAVLAADPVVGAARDTGAAAVVEAPAPTSDGDERPREDRPGPVVAENAAPDVDGDQDANVALAELLARMVERWRDGPASTVGQNVFRCDLDDAARAATASRLAQQVLPVLRAVGPGSAGGPDAELRAELAAMVLLGIGVARTAGTLPALAAADPDRLAELLRELLDTALG
ncbi:TetR/AcrR family transcriptional regulator [Pseudofrankia inefficax]|uniref:Regulatory protein TetR n=1 Tax=Pseudofrankia inefficax (strain DSM 45817 / CECT 9037 / DDB 130130 / EuI1c) TaxID=298654 RepID=E3J0E3_PSEI1|nr:TetR/AcrR family transcriptional regulator [Pseudofrankia inefficax]ADP81572.1 regulatory protein TetR [Pseudofrankia inefficax]